ncbi:hypothetical protein MAPG_09011 [Magnaporthiopsis poae ATCC 64411]|uniref:Sodium/calcium exchanger membrane region domain-containing protein n=1 Tax=Magnaporthiopsis poae (strain ATCC 64411 / 73-15) TaxID=644358 RepID=A0A0C4E8U2_MAGP6|nr:hypothetical protein MAPG_09011 [Magnaporthiopsis poae ATCC 64411]
MADASVVTYNIAVFISTLFLLEFGADQFIDHTAVVARRAGVSETVIGLVTAGAEWEELAVIVASLARGRSSLAIGNIVGAAISNILGAFSLGLLFYSRGEAIQFDRSARIYSLLLLVLTTLVAPVIYFRARVVWLVCGSALIGAFVVYILVAGAAIARGLLAAPEDSDSDSDSDSNSSTNERRNLVTTGVAAAAYLTFSNADGSPSGIPVVTANAEQTRPRRDQQHRLAYHCIRLLFGFLAICVAGYVLSQAAVNITDQFGISDVLFGVVILAVATTLPEKFVAVMSGHRGHPGILVANCAGSNIFLLSLCVGIIMVDTEGALDGGNVTIPELAVMWASTLGLTLVIWFGARYSRWLGAVMMAGYAVFIVSEFALVNRVAGFDAFAGSDQKPTWESV